MARVLYIGDIHEPVSHPGYLPFCCDLSDKYDCDQVVFIGDVVDHHAISFHAHHPEANGPQKESELALAGVQRWVDAFPVAKVCIGNHDARVIRLAESVNIPKKFIRDYAETWDTPDWEWANEFIIDGTYAFHGTGISGVHPAWNAMQKKMMSVVMGHIHSAAGIVWMANPDRRMFGMSLGCGIDDRAIEFAYGAHLIKRSILGAGVVLDGVPFHEIMPIGPGEKYHRSKFAAKESNEVRRSRSEAAHVRDAGIVPGLRPVESGRLFHDAAVRIAAERAARRSVKPQVRR